MLAEVWRATDSYGLVLILLLITYFLMLVVPEGPALRVTIVVLQGATTLFALRTSGVSRRRLRVATTVFVTAVVSLGTVRVLGFLPDYPGLAEALSGVLLLLAPVAIMRNILGHDRVDSKTVLGAVCVYVLIGMVFAFLYVTLARASGGELFVSGTATYANCLFFSFITMTTVGYGNLVPASGLGQALAVLEALLGQVFLVTFVARLVSLYGMSASGTREGARKD